MPASMSSFVKETSAEFNVFGMRPEWRTRKHAFRKTLATMRGEHLRHARPVGSSKVEGSDTVVSRHVMR